jgi:hypothetical protein
MTPGECGMCGGSSACRQGRIKWVNAIHHVAPLRGLARGDIGVARQCHERNIPNVAAACHWRDDSRVRILSCG